MSQPDIVIFLICSLRCIVSIVIILRFLLFLILSIRNKLELWRIISGSTSSGDGDPHKFLAEGPSSYYIVDVAERELQCFLS